LSRQITKIISFKVESTFQEWVKIFDSKEADLKYTEFKIQPLFRGCNIDDPKKVICIYHSIEGIFKSLFIQILNLIKVTNLISQ